MDDGIPLSAISVGKVWSQSEFGLTSQDSEDKTHFDSLSKFINWRGYQCLFWTGRSNDDFREETFFLWKNILWQEIWIYFFIAQPIYTTRIYGLKITSIIYFSSVNREIKKVIYIYNWKIK